MNPSLFSLFVPIVNLILETNVFWRSFGKKTWMDLDAEHFWKHVWLQPADEWADPLGEYGTYYYY